MTRSLRSWIHLALVVTLVGTLLAALAGPARANGIPPYDDVPDTGDKDAFKIYLFKPRLDVPDHEDTVIHQGDSVFVSARCEFREAWPNRCRYTGNRVHVWSGNGEHYLDTTYPGTYSFGLEVWGTRPGDDWETDPYQRYARKSWSYTVIADPCPDHRPGPGSCSPDDPPPPVDPEPDPEPTPPAQAELTIEGAPVIAALPDEQVALRLRGTGPNGIVSGFFSVLDEDQRVLVEDRMNLADEGRKTVLLPPLGLGEHQLTVRTEPTGRYDAAMTTVTIDARHATSLSTDGRLELEPGESGRFTVVADSEGSTDGGKVVVRREGASPIEATMEGGRAAVDVPPLPSGSHGLTVEFEGTDEAHPADATISATVGTWLRTEPDRYFVAAGGTLDVPAPGVLDNDEGVTDDWYVDFLTPADHGSGSVQTDGSISYTPYDKTWRGTDRMEYRVKNLGDDGPRRSRTMRVEIVVGGRWVDDVRVETRPFDQGWQDARPDEDDSAEVIDGNPTRLRYDLKNPTNTSQQVKVEVLTPEDDVVTGSTETVTLAAGQELERTSAVDTTGLAWTEAGEPAAEARHLRVRVTTADGGTDTGRAPVVVNPLPVVLVHGFNSNAAGWGGTGAGMDTHLHDVHPGLRGYAVGDGQFPGVMNTGDVFDPGVTYSVRRNAQETAEYVEGLRKHTGAHHVDVVAHSMGGIITRRYIGSYMPRSTDDRPVVRHLVQMGTPNMGSPCADDMMDAARDMDDLLIFPQPVTAELTTEVNWKLNLELPTTKGVELSNWVGTGIPLPCSKGGDSDGVVPVASARWTIPAHDLGTGEIVHTSMTQSAEIARDYIGPRLADAPSTEPTTKRSAAVERPVDDTATFGARVLEVPSEGAASVQMQVPTGSAFGYTAVGAGVEIELVDPSGRVVSTDRARDAALPFVSARVDRHTTGTWTMRASGRAGQVPVSFWVVDNPVRLHVDDVATDEDGDGTVRVRLTGGTGRVEAVLTDGRTDLRSVSLKRGSDGVLTGTLSDVPDDTDLVVVATATLDGGGRRMASAAVVPERLVAPVVTGQPASARAIIGRTARFTITTSGAVDAITWESSRGSGAWTAVPGARGPAHTVAVSGPHLNGVRYRAVVAGPGGSTTSSPATLTTVRATAHVSASYAVPRKKAGRATVKVAAIGTVPRGVVQVYDGSRRIATATLSSRSTVTVRLPKLKKGKHGIRVRYLGSTSVNPAWSPTRTVRVR